MSSKLKPKQLQAIYMLIGGATGREVANRLNLREETLSRWKRHRYFQMAYEKVKREARAKLDDQWQSLAEASVQAIRSELSHHGCDMKRVELALKMLEMLGIDVKTLSTATECRENAVDRLTD